MMEPIPKTLTVRQAVEALMERNPRSRILRSLKKGGLLQDILYGAEGDRTIDDTDDVFFGSGAVGRGKGRSPSVGSFSPYDDRAGREGGRSVRSISTSAVKKVWDKSNSSRRDGEQQSAEEATAAAASTPAAAAAPRRRRFADDEEKPWRRVSLEEQNAQKPRGRRASSGGSDDSSGSSSSSGFDFDGLFSDFDFGGDSRADSQWQSREPRAAPKRRQNEKPRDEFAVQGEEDFDRFDIFLH